MLRICFVYIDDLFVISVVCLVVFIVVVVFLFSVVGIVIFGSVVVVDVFVVCLQGDNYILVVEQDDCIVGVVELKEGCYLVMLFVDFVCQGKGIGYVLFEVVLLQVCELVLIVCVLFNVVLIYLCYGFVVDGEVGEFNGLVYQQMMWVVV